jgi:hypothetical protein
MVRVVCYTGAARRIRAAMLASHRLESGRGRCFELAGGEGFVLRVQREETARASIVRRFENHRTFAEVSLDGIVSDAIGNPDLAQPAEDGAGRSIDRDD